LTLFLLDTHVLLWMIGQTRFDLPAKLQTQIEEGPLNASAISIWEVAIKHRSGKLKITLGLDELLDICRAYSVSLIAMTPEDAIAELYPLPATRDPFDRMLLTQCSVRGWKLLTIDKALIDHPMALR
jgi:PIN domain nuclease of toxin-antitoxin system